MNLRQFRDRYDKAAVRELVLSLDPPMSLGYLEHLLAERQRVSWHNARRLVQASEDLGYRPGEGLTLEGLRPDIWG